MKPRDHQDVISRGLLEGEHYVGIDEAAVAEQHGAKHRCAFRVIGEEGIKACEEIAARPRQAVLKRGPRTINDLQEFAASKRTYHINFLPCEEAVNVKRTRIQIISRRTRLQQRFHSVTGAQTLH